MTYKSPTLAKSPATRVGSLFLGFAILAMTSIGAMAAKAPKMSELLDNNGFQTLLFALDTAGLTSVIDGSKVVLFGPTDDVFDATATLLGCGDAAGLATALQAVTVNTPDGDVDGLTYVLTYHAYLGKIKDDTQILTANTLEMANGLSIATGADMNGLGVTGDFNAGPSNITTPALKAKKGTLYGVDSILLPIDPTGLCS